MRRKIISLVTAFAILCSIFMNGMIPNVFAGETGGVALSTPTVVYFQLGTALWSAVPNASSYSVQLYKDGSTYGSAVTVAGDTVFYDFNSAITETGDYTFKVKAIGDGSNYTDSTESAGSEVYHYTAPGTLVSVDGKTDNTSKNSGADAGNAIIWNINVENSKAVLALGDIEVTTGAAVELYSVPEFQNQITGSDTLPLFEGGVTTAYIIVKSNGGAKALYYKVTITREGKVDYTINDQKFSWVNGIGTIYLNSDDNLVLFTNPGEEKKIDITSPDGSAVTIEGNSVNCTNIYIVVENDITLTIKDLNITASGVKDGLLLNKTDNDTSTTMTLIVKGTCNIKGSSYGSGIHSVHDQKLVISGDGVLNAIGGDSKTININGSMGIRMEAYDGTPSSPQAGPGAVLTIEGNVTVNATGGDFMSGFGGSGIQIEFGDIAIKGGTVNAKSGVAYGTNYNSSAAMKAAFLASDHTKGGNITIEGGTVTATGGDAELVKGGDAIYAFSALNISGGTIHAIGGKSDNTYGGTAIYSYEKNINITGGTVEATGGNGDTNPSIAVYSEFGDINISEAKVTALGGNGNVNGSHAIYSNRGNITISHGADVTAIGGNGTTGMGGVGLRAYGYDGVSTGSGKTVTISSDAGNVYVRGGRGASAQRESVRGKDVFIATGNVGPVVMEGTNPRSVKNKPDSDDVYMVSVTADPAAPVVILSSVNGTLGGSYTYSAATKADGVATMWLPAGQQTVASTGYYSKTSTVAANDTNAVTISKVPYAPTNPVQDDVDNTFGWTNVEGFTNSSDYEYSLDGGFTWAAVTNNPQRLPNEAYDIGNVQVRVKADTDTGRQAGVPLASTAEYTAGVMLVHLIHGLTTTDYGTIQAAVKAAVDGDTVNIDAGTFREQVTITKNITLQGAGKDKTIIEAPAAADLKQTGGDWKNLKNQDIYTVIGVKTTNSSGTVVIKNLEVDGRDQGYLPDAKYPDKMNYAYQGIGVYNTNTTIDNVNVTGVREKASDYSGYTPVAGYTDEPSGMNHNEAIFVESAAGQSQHKLIVTNSYITKFQKTAILVWGPTLEVDIHDNTIQGYEKTLHSSGNGIQVASSDRSSQGGANGDRRGTTGSVKNNQILGIGQVVPEPPKVGEPDNGSYLNPGQGGPAAILLYQAGEGFEISGNSIEGTGYLPWYNADITYNNDGFCNDAITISDSKNALITNNTVSGFFAAIFEESAVSGSKMTISGNSFTNNSIDVWSAGQDDEISLGLGNDAETVGYKDKQAGIDTIYNFGTGDRIQVFGYVKRSDNGSVNGFIGDDPVKVNNIPYKYNDAQLVVDFTGGTVTRGNGSNLTPSSIQLSVADNITTLYIDTDGAGGASELQVKLDGVYVPADFSLQGGYINYIGAPRLVSQSPEAGKHEVSVDSKLVMNFNEAVTAVTGKSIVIKKKSDDSTVETIAATDTARVKITGSTVAISLAADLYYSTEYYVLVDEGAFTSARNTSYEGLQGKDVWNFTTEMRSEVTAKNSAEFAYYMANDAVSVINLVEGTTYQYEGGTVSRALTINGNGACIVAGKGIVEDIIRSDGVVFYGLGNYTNERTFIRVAGAQGYLKLNDVTLQNGSIKNGGTDISADGICAAINVKSGASLEMDKVTLKDFHNNPTKGNKNAFGVHAEPGAAKTVITNCTFDSSNAFRNAVAIREGSFDISNNTFSGTKYPERLRQDDGYEYAIYIFGGTGTVKQNTITGFVNSNQQGYTSAGIAVTGFYKTDVTIENNTLAQNVGGIGVTGYWSGAGTNTDVKINGKALVTSQDAYAIGETLKKANQQESVEVMLDQNNEVQMGVDGNKYFAVLGGYTSPFITLTKTEGDKVTIQIPADGTDTVNAAYAKVFEVQKDGDTAWTEVEASACKFVTATNVELTLDPGHTYSIRLKMTHKSYTETSDPTERTLVTYSNPVYRLGAPTNITVTPGNSEATITFTAPVNNGGSPITGYVVTTSPGGITTNVSGSSITIKGLTNGTAYTFTVKAVNAEGEGAESAATAPVIPMTVPAAPTGVTAAAGDKEVDVSFTAPSDNGGSSITGYTIYVYENGIKKDELTKSGTTSPIKVTGLTNKKAYTFIVVATNGKGDSAESEASAPATPRTVPGAPTNVKATAGNGEATITFTAPVDDGGSPITGYVVTASPGGKTATGTGNSVIVKGLSNGTTYTFTVKAVNAAGESAVSEQSSATPYVPISTKETDKTDKTDVIVLVNGKSENAGTATSSKEDGKTVTTISVDEAKLEKKLASEGNNAVVTIPVNTDADVVRGELNGNMLKKMEDKAAVLEVKTGTASYSLPAQQLNIADISAQLGQNVDLKDIKVQIEIAKASVETAKVVENSARKGEFTIVAPPVEFAVKCSSGDKTVEIKNFNTYVERTVAIPEGVDPNKITTGIVVEPNGTVRHVPTKITVIDGKYYAVINSLTNSSYSVVWHPLEFADVANHWAKNAVNDMGSRMVVSGTGNGMFEPERNITRAEFAAIVVKALGLKPGEGNNPFADVNASDWYCQYIQTARAYGIIEGYNATTFGPNDSITREQAMTMVAKAMKITGLKPELTDSEIGSALEKYTDGSIASEYAKSSIAACLKNGIVSGKGNGRIAPKDNITRAEVAAIIQKLLQKSDLI